MNQLNDLFSSFSPAGKDAWAKAVNAEIEGKNAFEHLLWERAGVTGLPYYDAADQPDKTFNLPLSKNEFLGARSWYNMPLVKVLADEEANKKALHHLTSGADGIIFDLGQNNDISLQKLLTEIEWPICQVAFLVDQHAEFFFSTLEKYLLEKKFEPASIGGFVLLKTYPHYPQSLHKVVHNLSPYKNFKLIGITSSHTNRIEFLSDLLLKAVTEVEVLTDAGVPEVTALHQVFFFVPIGQDFFLELATLKVLRMLWYQVMNAYGVKNYSAADVPIHVIHPVWNHEAFQPHENMLAATTAGLSAILGGCTSLSLEPAAPEERLERIALNVSTILREESHLNKVADPTAGSYYLESIIKNLADAAWTRFTNQLKEG